MCTALFFSLCFDTCSGSKKTKVFGFSQTQHILNVSFHVPSSGYPYKTQNKVHLMQIKFMQYGITFTLQNVSYGI